MAKLSSTHIYGDLYVDGTINGALSGNASTATTLQTARTINGTSFNGSANITTANWGTSRTLTIGKKGQSVNGSANITWSLADIGAVAKAGDTMSGPLKINGAASTFPLQTRGIVGNSADGSSIDDLYLQYGANKKLMLGNTGAYEISADGSSYTGNAATATKATQDSAGQQINTTYIKGLSVSGKTITYTKGNGTTGTISTQDTVYSHPNSGATAGSYGPSANASPAHSGTFSVPYITINAAGHITSASTKTITLPADNNTWRGIQNNLTSTATDQSLSAAQGKILQDNKADKTLLGEDLSSKTMSLNDLNLSSGSPKFKVYYCPTDGGGSNITGRPNDSSKQAFNLIIESLRWASTTDYITKQTYVQGAQKIIYVRYCTNGTWSAWEKVYTSAQKPTAADIGAAAASHGTHLTIGTGASNAAAGNHTHSYAGSASAGGAANSVKTNLTIKLNGGSTEGTDLFTFNGSTAKTVNITPSAIGAAASSHGTHLTIGTGASNAAAGNHTHNYAGSSSAGGAATSATKLATSRTISLGGVLSGSASFDGSANASISASIAKPPKSGDWFSGGITTVGTDGVMEIGKYVDFHNSDGSTNDYDVRLQCNTAGPIVLTLPTSGGTLALTSQLGSYLPLSGGTMTGAIKAGGLTGSWVDAAKNSKAVISSTAGAGTYHPVYTFKSTNGSIVLAGYQGALQCSYLTKANVDSGTNTTTTAQIFTENGGAVYPNVVKAYQHQATMSVYSQNTSGGVFACGGTFGLASTDASVFQACFRNASSRAICDLGTNNLPGRLYIRSGQGTAGSGVSLETAVTNGTNYVQWLSPEAGTVALTKHLSDRTRKDNIVYIDSEESEFTNKDFYDFIKDNLDLATYNLKKEYAATDTHTKLNFIAQDILWDFKKNEENKVGNLIIQAEDAMEQQLSLKYDPEIFTSVIAGALKESINKIEEDNEKIKTLENKVKELESKNKALEELVYSMNERLLNLEDNI